jgi:hypothetical protein
VKAGERMLAKVALSIASWPVSWMMLPIVKERPGVGTSRHLEHVFSIIWGGTHILKLWFWRWPNTVEVVQPPIPVVDQNLGEAN